jgi:hypothetical protein
MLVGGCLCGTVRYRAAGAVHEVHHCHCGMCRKAHGAAFSTFVRLAADGFAVVAGETAVRRFRASPPIERTFCGTCGTRLTVRFDGMPESVWVALATLDGDPGLRPAMHVFVASKAPWFEISDALPQFPEYGPMGD